MSDKIPSIRISADIRDRVVDNVLARKFATADLPLIEERAAIEKLQKEQKILGYEMAFNERERKILEGAPSGWFPQSYNVRVSVEGGGVEEIYFDGKKPVPYQCHQTYNHVVAVVPAEGRFWDLSKEILERETRLDVQRNEIEDQKRSLRARVLAIVNSVTTVNRLLQVWPEVREFLPEEMSGPRASVPALMIEDLNNFLGLEPGEPEPT